MKKKKAIFWSKGSIGKNLINILKQKANLFEIKLLSTNKNYREIINQITKLNVKNVIIKDLESYEKFLKIPPPPPFVLFKC